MRSVDSFAELVAGGEDAIELDRAALAVGAALEPAADVLGALEALNRMAEGVKDIADLRLRLFAELGFLGDGRGYRDPVNAYLHRVVERRRGIPISLSILTIEVGRRAGVALEGVNMPGHFVVRQSGSLYLDPFFGGLLLDEQALEERYRQVNPSAGLGSFGPEHRRSATKVEMLDRLLGNLVTSFTRDSDPVRLEVTLRLRLALPGADARLWLEVAQAMAAQGRFAAAAAELGSVGQTLDQDLQPLFAAAARGLVARLN